MLENNEAPLRARDRTSIRVAGCNILDLLCKQVCRDESQLSTVDPVGFVVLGVGSVQTLLPKARCPFNDVALPALHKGNFMRPPNWNRGSYISHTTSSLRNFNCMGSVSDSCEL